MMVAYIAAFPALLGWKTGSWNWGRRYERVASAWRVIFVCWGDNLCVERSYGGREGGRIEVERRLPCFSDAVVVAEGEVDDRPVPFSCVACVHRLVPYLVEEVKDFFLGDVDGGAEVVGGQVGGRGLEVRVGAKEVFCMRAGHDELAAIYAEAIVGCSAQRDEVVGWVL
jgi:hypothetical protein